ncbi:hypothetical protein [Streptomyces sp. GC420]|uniref:hypothetical protein n=1 Tax=Streptomyces sp. GC420 TaxID=2697568 RepID=UPI001414E10B|nr:hypothetical protein [Streptomyces sp. GC420]NBM18476.1 hypothetical protein [Streptomyces sp. GC420]
MSDAPVDPAEIPVFTGDEVLLGQMVKALSSDGEKVASAAGEVHKTFGGLRAFYEAPEAEQLFGTTQPVVKTANDLKSDMSSIAGALGAYADEIRPLVERLKQLKRDAEAFRAKVADDDKWREDGDLIDENLARRNEIAEVWSQFHAAERTCHAKIVGLVGGTALKVNDGSNGKDMYGYDAEALKQAESLPWGDAVKESTPWWQVWEHAYDFGKGIVVDGVWGTIRGLGTLVGVDGWDAAGQAWTGLGKLLTGLAITAVPVAGAAFWAMPEDKLPSWLRDSRTAMKETGKALLAWDQWGENPSRAAGAVTFNVVTTIFTGGAGGAASGAGKAGAAAKAISLAGKAGRAIDPTTYLFKGAGAGLSKIGDVMAGLKGMGKIDIPPMPDNVVSLPEGSFKLPDGTLSLPEGAAVPPGAIEVPANTVRLPENTPLPAGAVDLGDGMVRLPENTPAPAGSVPVPEGTVKVPEGAFVLPEGSVRMTDLDGNPVYMDPKGNLYDGDGILRQDAGDAPRGADGNPAAGADNPRVDTPVREPALVGAGANTADNAAHIRLGDGLGDVGRAGDDALPGPRNPGDNLPGGTAANLPGGTADHLPVNNLDNGPLGGGHLGDNPPAGGNLGDNAPVGRTETPGTGPATGHDLPGGPAADNGIPGGRTDVPGAGGLDDLGRGGDHTAGGAGRPDGDPSGRVEVPRPDFMREGASPYGPRGSLTLEQIEDIQVYRANEEPGYFENHYRKDGTRKSLDLHDESGFTPPQLTRLSEDGPWIRAKDVPAPPKPHFLDPDYIPVAADTVTSASRLRILEEAAQTRHFAIQWDNIVADWKAEAGRIHDAHGTADSAAQWAEARGTYKESHTAMGDAAEAFGEKAAEHHFVAERYPDFDKQPLLGPKNGNDQFDQVWKHEDGRMVVIEAKSSPGTELGRRTLPGGRQVSQGSREYFFDIIRMMTKRGELGLVADLKKALADGKLDYVVIKGEKNTGTYTGYQYRRFDISKGTLP